MTFEQELKRSIDSQLLAECAQAPHIDNRVKVLADRYIELVTMLSYNGMLDSEQKLKLTKIY